MITLQKIRADRFPVRMTALLMLSIVTILAMQFWWKVPLETLGSPADLLSLALGLLLVLSCWLVSFRTAPTSKTQRLLTAMTILFLSLTIAEYFLDAGAIDIPIAFLWLAPALILALTGTVSKEFGPARLSFLVVVILQLAEAGRSILAALNYGGLPGLAIFDWAESASDLLARAFYLVGFAEAFRAGGFAGSLPPSIASDALRPLHGSSHRMHIAIFMYKLSGGGAQRRSITLANGLTSRGYSVELVVINDSTKYAHLLAPGIRFVALNQPQWGRLNAALYRYLPYRWTRVYLGTMALAHYLQVERPGILVAASDRAHLTAGIAWQIAGRLMPLVLRATNFPSANLNLWTPMLGLVDFYLGGLTRLVFAPATAVVAVADGVADEIVRLSGLPRARIATVFEPVLDQSVLEKSLVPLSHPWLEPGQPPVLLAVGHLRMQKDFPTLIKAFALARARRPMRLVLLGEGSQRPRLQKLIASLGVEADVCLFGHTENPFAWMARSSMFVLSSAWEGLPAVLIEALACGCPVVSTNCPSGPWEILDKGKYGKLVPCRNPESLSQAILETLDAEVDRSALRQRARAFSAEASVDSYVAIFEAAMSAYAMMDNGPSPLIFSPNSLC